MSKINAIFINHHKRFLFLEIHKFDIIGGAMGIEEDVRKTIGLLPYCYETLIKFHQN